MQSSERAFQSGKCILLVEDNPDNANIYKTALEYGGYTVLHVTDGEAAVACAVRDLPDLILMDISLPKMDGWAAAVKILACPECVDIPIIAVTAHAFETDRLRAQQLGFRDYLAKPIEPRRVLQVVRHLLGPPGVPLAS